MYDIVVIMHFFIYATLIDKIHIIYDNTGRNNW